MAKFEGFSEIALLYAEKYELVEAMQKQFEDERKTLSAALHDKIARQDWCKPNSVHHSGGYLRLGLFSDHTGGEILVMQLWLSPLDLANRVFRYVLSIGDKRLKGSFRQQAGDFLCQEFSSEEYEPLNKSANSTIIDREVHYEASEILETMFAELEKLRAFLPFAEKAYQQPSS